MRRTLQSFRLALFLGMCGLSLVCDAADAVKFTDRGESVSLDNGIVAFEVKKTNGDISALKYRGASILAAPGYLDWVSNGNNHIRNGVFTLRTDPARNGVETAEASN